MGKIVIKTDLKTGQSHKYLEYLEGEVKAQSNITFAFHKGLKAGDYLVMYQASFKPEQLKKVSIQVYCEFDNQVIPIENKSFGLSRFETFCSNLDESDYEDDE